ncbi:uncharacterized protein LOC144433332 [Glandiceps talaboti]
MDLQRSTSSSPCRCSTKLVLLLVIIYVFILLIPYNDIAISYQYPKPAAGYHVVTSPTPMSLLASLEQCAERVNASLSQWKNTFGLDKGILKRALNHVTSTLAFERAVLKALTRNTTLHVGIAGGSISARKYSYANVLTKAMQDALRVPVVLHNAATGATDSIYYSYCFGAHLDIQELDIVLWEFAANDFIKKIGPWAQEEFTRVILNLTSQPQLIFVNFLHGLQIKHKSCVNNEKIASEPISEYYDVPSISMPDVICPMVKRGNYLRFVNSKTDGHPNTKNHRLMGMFLVEFFKVVLNNLMPKVQAGLPNGRSMLEEAFPYRNKLPRPLFKDTAVVFLPKCWSTLGTRERLMTTLKPNDVNGWVLSSLKNVSNSERTDIKQFWQSRYVDSYITFRLDIEPYRDLNCVVLIIASRGPFCGKVRVHIDKAVEKSVVVDGKWNYKVTVTKRISSNLKPGTHNLTLTSLSKKPFRLAAIAISYVTT